MMKAAFLCYKNAKHFPQIISNLALYPLHSAVASLSETFRGSRANGVPFPMYTKRSSAMQEPGILKSTFPLSLTYAKNQKDFHCECRCFYKLSILLLFSSFHKLVLILEVILGSVSLLVAIPVL